MATSGITALSDVTKETLQKLICDGLQFYQPPDELLCCNCGLVPIFHNIFDCGHPYCRDCYRMFCEQKRSCRKCKTECNTQKLENDELKHRIYKLKTICPNSTNGCSHLDDLDNILTHLQECKYIEENEVNREHPKDDVDNDRLLTEIRDVKLSVMKMQKEIEDRTNDKLEKMMTKIDATTARLDAFDKDKKIIVDILKAIEINFSRLVDQACTNDNVKQLDQQSQPTGPQKPTEQRQYSQWMPMAKQPHPNPKKVEALQMSSDNRPKEEQFVPQFYTSMGNSKMFEQAQTHDSTPKSEKLWPYTTNKSENLWPTTNKSENMRPTTNKSENLWPTTNKSENLWPNTNKSENLWPTTTNNNQTKPAQDPFKYYIYNPKTSPAIDKGIEFLMPLKKESGNSCFELGKTVATENTLKSSPTKNTENSKLFKTDPHKNVVISDKTVSPSTDYGGYLSSTSQTSNSSKVDSSKKAPFGKESMFSSATLSDLSSAENSKSPKAGSSKDAGNDYPISSTKNLTQISLLQNTNSPKAGPSKDTGTGNKYTISSTDNNLSFLQNAKSSKASPSKDVGAGNKFITYPVDNNLLFLQNSKSKQKGDSGKLGNIGVRSSEVGVKSKNAIGLSDGQKSKYKEEGPKKSFYRSWWE